MLDTVALMAKGFRPYRKTSITYARKMSKPFCVRLLNGDIIYGKSGDYACASPGGQDRWIAEQTIFENTYVLAPDQQHHTIRLQRLGFHAYRKHQIVWAKKIRQPGVVKTLEGEVHAQAGDYLCIGPTGEKWPQQASRFEANYERVAAMVG